jgi:hypothetical protein
MDDDDVGIIFLYSLQYTALYTAGVCRRRLAGSTSDAAQMAGSVEINNEWFLLIIPCLIIL